MVVDAPYLGSSLAEDFWKSASQNALLTRLPRKALDRTLAFFICSILHDIQFIDDSLLQSPGLILDHSLNIVFQGGM